MFCHEEGVLPLCARQFIARDNFPSGLVVSIDKHLPRSHVDHRFDSKDHSRNEQHALAAITEVGHIGLFMELTP